MLMKSGKIVVYIFRRLEISKCYDEIMKYFISYAKQRKAGKNNMRAARINLTEKRLLSVRELCIYTSRGRNQATEWGRKIGAEVRFGKRVFFDRYVIDREIDKIIAQNQKEA